MDSKGKTLLFRVPCNSCPHSPADQQHWSWSRLENRNWAQQSCSATGFAELAEVLGDFQSHFQQDEESKKREKSKDRLTQREKQGQVDASQTETLQHTSDASQTNTGGRTDGVDETVDEVAKTSNTIHAYSNNNDFACQQ